MKVSTPALDQDAALASVLRSLRSDFSPTFDDETIETFLAHSYKELAARAKSNNHLPLLAGRFARQRLVALARVEDKHRDATPVVLFLCTHNSGRSQMALGFFPHHAGEAAIDRMVRRIAPDRLHQRSRHRRDGRARNRHL